MEDFITLFSLEFKRFFRKKKLMILLLIVLFTIFVSNIAFSDYKKTLLNIQEFQKLDASKFNKYIKNYTEYSFYGVKCFFIPSPLGILLKTSGTTAELSAQVDSIVSLDIFINAKGNAIFEEDSISPFRISFIILVLVVLSVLFLGYELMRDKGFMKMISGILSPLKIFIYLVLSRIILLTLILICFFAIISIMIKLNGFNLSNEVVMGLFGYFLSTWIMIIMFFLIGVLVGNIQKTGTALTVLISIWFIFVFFLPGLLDSYISNKSKTIKSSYKVEFEQLEIVCNFEKNGSKKFGKFSEEKRGRFGELAEYYWNSVYYKIEELEVKLKNDISSLIKKHKKYAIFSPVSFFQLTGNEVSSMGFENYLKFYSFLQALKKDFLRFWIDRVYYNDPKELVSFIKGNENLYYAESKLPDNFGTGVMINMGYIIILFFISFFRFKKAMFPAPKDVYAFENIDFNLVSGKHMSYKIYHKHFIPHILNVFFGECNKFTGTFKIDGVNVVTKKKKDFIYLPKPERLPGDIKVNSFLTLFKKLLKVPNEDFQKIRSGLGASIIKKSLHSLENSDKALLLLQVAQMKKSPVYIIDNITLGIPDEYQQELKQIVTQLKNSGALIIDFITDQNLWMEPDSYSPIKYDGKSYFEVNANSYNKLKK